MNKDEIQKAYLPTEIEEKWYSTWLEKGYFKAVIDKSKKPYSIVIPPPNITGILTLGHVLNNTLQDILIRWKRMQGYSVCWFPGTDHAGIATESRVDRYLKEKEKKDRHDFGREAFIDKVWEWKKEYGGTIIEQLKKLGSSCDWDKERFTLDEGLSNAVKKVFIELYNKGYIYRGVRMINWCPQSRTALSDEEVIYKEVNGAFYHIRYPLTDGSGYLEIATTRPETMLGDTAVAVNKDDTRYSHLVGKTLTIPISGRIVPIIVDEIADMNFGTGCVKITPAHDPNDFLVGKRHNLDIINILNLDGTMNEKAGKDFSGMDRFQCRKKIVEILKESGALLKVENHKHNVGYSERGDVPVEPMVSAQWFVNMKELAKPAIDAVRSGKIKFYPERWSKVYFNWMENIQDWCISRQIWWGHRIPAWYNQDNGDIFVGAEAPNTGNWKQEEDVLDTWFSSWLWPFSIMGWPDKTEELEYFYPTNDLVTGPDIIFFWVARMIMAGFEFKNEIPFQNVYFTSIIRDAQGRKLSKSLGNSPDPLEVIATYGSDALRFSIIYIAPVGLDIRYSNEKCEIGRNFANKIWNACRFRQMHGNINQKPDDISSLKINNFIEDDKWIISRLNNLIEMVNSSLDKFAFQTATQEIYNFVWSEFCDWYIETSKNRIYSEGESKETVLGVLDFVIYNILKILHPFMPFITEELSHQMGFLKENESIMFKEFPKSLKDTLLVSAVNDNEKIALVESKFDIIRAGRNMRSTYNIQPAKKIIFSLIVESDKILTYVKNQESIIKTMLNAESLNIITDNNVVENKQSPSTVMSCGTLFLNLKDAINIEEEIAKITKQKSELENWIKTSKSKLSNERFLAGAPKDVVTAAKEHLSDMENRLANIEKTLQTLKY